MEKEIGSARLVTNKHSMTLLQNSTHFRRRATRIRLLSCSYSEITLLFGPQICKTRVCIIHHHAQCIDGLIGMTTDKPADKDEGVDAAADDS